ncbi:hypothetical protein [Reichenbachiella versicolor]|uniref:hypothetical protein n=1 Tax=Reichenbachiella versicolor TaxID=1821036 RepID=UPI000D6E8A50|nr:hypothetical protein [Reichenbachiella versicolor]
MNEKILIDSVKNLDKVQMAEYFYSNKVSLQRVQNFPVELREKAISALERRDKSLSKGLQLFYFLLPTGRFTSFSGAGPKYMENGYFKKEKQFQIASWLGIFFYVVLFFVISKLF